MYKYSYFPVKKGEQFHVFYCLHHIPLQLYVLLEKHWVLLLLFFQFAQNLIFGSPFCPVCNASPAVVTISSSLKTFVFFVLFVDVVSISDWFCSNNTLLYQDWKLFPSVAPQTCPVRNATIFTISFQKMYFMQQS